MTSHYLNQCLVIVNWTLSNKLQLNFNQNTKFFILENTSVNVICEMAEILSRRRWVDSSPPGQNLRHFALIRTIQYRSIAITHLCSLHNWEHCNGILMHDHHKSDITLHLWFYLLRYLTISVVYSCVSVVVCVCVRLSPQFVPQSSAGHWPHTYPQNRHLAPCCYPSSYLSWRLSN